MSTAENEEAKRQWALVPEILRELDTMSDQAFVEKLRWCRANMPYNEMAVGWGDVVRQMTNERLLLKR